MKIKNSVKIAFRNLNRRKMRTFLTAFAVSIGAMLIILMVSLGVGVQNIIENTLNADAAANVVNVSKYYSGDLANTENKDEVKNKVLHKDALEKIKSINEVDDISVFNYIPSIEKSFMDKDINDTVILAYDLNYPIFTENAIENVRIREKNNDLEPIIYGRMLTKEDKDSILVGKKLLDKIGVEDAESVIGNEITLTAKLPNSLGISNMEPLVKSFKIVGVVGENFPNSEQLVASIDDTKDLLGYVNLNNNYYEENGADKLEVTLKNISDVPGFQDEISQMGYQATSFQSKMKDVKSMFTMVNAVLAIVGIIIIFVAALGVINTMTMAIYERTRSIGIMKSLGCSRKDIRKLFIIESASIGFIGGVIGLVFSLVNTQIIKFALDMILREKGITNVPNVFSTPIWLVFGTIGFAILISVLSGLYPANKASKLDPIESLRYE